MQFEHYVVMMIMQQLKSSQNNVKKSQMRQKDVVCHRAGVPNLFVSVSPLTSVAYPHRYKCTQDITDLRPFKF
jgi:hypothetical protein